MKILSILLLTASILTASEDILSDKIFGSDLFTGKFAENKTLKHNQDYKINIGDVVSVKIWGGIAMDIEPTVDAQGNIFIPKVGTVHIAGEENKNINEIINTKIKSIFIDSVYSYADVKQYQPVSIYVTGMVKTPGLFDGSSSDSILQFLDKAGGISRSGSYRNIEIKRPGFKDALKKVDLYDFLISGQINSFNFKNGDIILVNNSSNYVKINNKTEAPVFYEINGNESLQNVLKFFKQQKNITSVVVKKNTGENGSSIKVAIDDDTILSAGDELTLLSEHSNKNIVINLSGETSKKSIVQSNGDNLQTLINNIDCNKMCDLTNVKLYRKSVAERQKTLIEASLKELESNALTTSSSTTEEANIRKQETQSILNFIDRAKKIEPLGQVVIDSKSDLSLIALQDGDRVEIPQKNQPVIIQGEVLSASAQIFTQNKTIQDYINASGGLTDRADENKILIIRASGSVLKYNSSSLLNSAPEINPGDSILVLSKVDEKRFQMAKDITQVMYQIAVGAAVAIAAF